MPTILTVTFNPAVDKSTTVPALEPEKKLNGSLPLYEPGGGGINVARAIGKLGGEAIAAYLSGGLNGQKLNNLLEAALVPSLITHIAEETRENFTVLDEKTQQQYRFGMPGPTVQEQEWQTCLANIDAQTNLQYIVASGSLSPGIPIDVFARLAAIAKKKNARLVVDTSGDALKEAVKAGVYLIKPNLGELGYLLGKQELKEAEVSEVARELLAQGKVEVIVVSMGAKGAMLVNKSSQWLVLPPPVVRKSTVGAGDSMVAGITLQLSRKKSLLESLQYGVACGTAATMNPGTQLCSKADADHLYQLIQAQSV